MTRFLPYRSPSVGMRYGIFIIIRKAKSRKIRRNHLQMNEHFIRDPRDALRIPLRQ